jgi:hypothetical protein
MTKEILCYISLFLSGFSLGVSVANMIWVCRKR